MFRGYYRRRSTVTWVVWCGAFLFLCLFLAWRLQWLPGSGSGESPIVEDSADQSELDADQSASNNDAGEQPVEPSLLSRQSEPNDEFQEPERFQNPFPPRGRSKPAFLSGSGSRSGLGSPSGSGTRFEDSVGSGTSAGGGGSNTVADQPNGSSTTSYRRNASSQRGTSGTRSAPDGRSLRVSYPRDGRSDGGARSRRGNQSARNSVPPVPPETGRRNGSGIRLAGHYRSGTGDSGTGDSGTSGRGSGEPSSPPASHLADIDRKIQAGDYLSAHKDLSTIYWNKPHWRDAIKRRIEMTARTIYFDPQPHFLKPYVVEYGDQLRSVAKQYGITWQYLAKLNDIPLDRVNRIRPGERLKVVKGPFSAVIDLSERELIVHHYWYYVARYRVGIGRDGRTPLGKLTIKNKVVDPPYTGIDENTGRRVNLAGDDPRNPLGTRWLDLGDSYGIHGTIDPDSIGKAESRGCIRMLNSDVEEVYDFLTVDSEVIIQR